MVFSPFNFTLSIVCEECIFGPSPTVSWFRTRQMSYRVKNIISISTKMRVRRISRTAIYSFLVNIVIMSDLWQ